MSHLFSADLQKAIDGEDYALAAKLRDEIYNLEADSLAAAAKALAFENAKFAYRLGQKLKHKIFGIIAYRLGLALQVSIKYKFIYSISGAPRT